MTWLLIYTKPNRLKKIPQLYVEGLTINLILRFAQELKTINNDTFQI
jgi:hypothetical protein